MSRPNPLNLAVFVAGLLVLGTLPAIVKGGLYLTNYEGDALHLADIVLRMAAGQRPHIDFMTPLGVFSVWPIAAVHRAGVDVGQAFVLAQAGFAGLVGIVIWWSAVTRLPRYTAYAFAASSMALLTSLAHGYDVPNLAVSMHYNRWAWGLTFAAVLMAALPPVGAPRPRTEGVVMAVIVWCLAFLKVTFAVALAPAILLILLIRGETRTVLAGVMAGIVLAALTLVVPGYSSVAAYVGDLFAALRAPLRGAPGLPWNALLVSPAFLAPSAVLTGSAIYLRNAGHRAEGLSLLLLLPPFVFITWQNFGNAPLWLIPVAAILAATYMRDPTGLRPVGAAAIVAAALSIAPVVVHGGSGIRLLAIDTSAYTPMVPGRAELDDMHVAALPAQLLRARTVLNDPGRAFEDVKVDRPEPEQIGGEELSECQLLTGINAALETLTNETPAEAHPLFVADVLSGHWLFGGAPLPGAAPWNYGTLHGFENADYVLVPLCAVDMPARRAILEQLNASDASFRMVQQTPRHWLLQID